MDFHARESMVAAFEADYTEAMRLNTDTQLIDCPYCGENYELIVDTSEGEQSYIEDCYVCCAPIQFTVTVSGTGEFTVLAQHENDC